MSEEMVAVPRELWARIANHIARNSIGWGCFRGNESDVCVHCDPDASELLNEMEKLNDA